MDLAGGTYLKDVDVCSFIFFLENNKNPGTFMFPESDLGACCLTILKGISLQEKRHKFTSGLEIPPTDC